MLGHIKKDQWQIKMMAVFFFIAHEKGFKFHAKPQTGANSCLSLCVECGRNFEYREDLERNYSPQYPLVKITDNDRLSTTYREDASDGADSL